MTTDSMRAAHGMPGTPALALDRVTLDLGGRSVLRDVSFEIGAGQFVGVLGPNGAGKTTLMRAILGLVPPARGTIRVASAPVTRGDPAIGYMPQMRALADKRIRGYDFVAMAAQGYRWGLPLGNRRTREEVAHALALVDGSALAQRTLAELSGGERQRLLLAQCLLGKPRLLLLDETLISLDPKHQHGVVELVKRVQRDLGITVLFSAHELNPLLGALDQVLYLGRGEAALGTVEEVITGPVLSRLYGAPIDVMRVGGRIFVMSDDSEIERHDHGCDHAHDHHSAHHPHRHRHTHDV